MAKIDKIYHDLLNDILTNGTKKADRTGTGTISVFGRQLRYNMEDGFPLLTTKRLHTRSIFTSSCGSYKVTPTSNTWQKTE